MHLRARLWLYAGVLSLLWLGAAARALVVRAQVPQEFAQKVLLLTNQQQALAGLPPFSLESHLDDAAGWYAADMAAFDYFNFDHSDRLGRTYLERLRAFGYPADGATSWGVGENIAAGYATPIPPLTPHITATPTTRIKRPWPTWLPAIWSSS